MGPYSFHASLLEHVAQMLALGLDCSVEKLSCRQKSPLVVGGALTQVLAGPCRYLVIASVMHVQLHCF